MRRFTVPFMLVLAATLAFAQAKKVKSKSEFTAIQGLQQAQQAGDPDGIIKAADNLITNFADTDFKSYALGVEAEAYEQKGDHAKAIVYGEQALAADPKAYTTDTLLANIYANTTRDTDLDKEEKLAKAEKYAKDAIAATQSAEKPNPQIPDDQWEHMKNNEQAQAYQALGTAALVRKKYDEAIADFEKGVNLDPDPVIMIRTGRALLAAHKPDDAITWFDKAAAAPNATAQVKTIAASDKARAQALKK